MTFNEYMKKVSEALAENARTALGSSKMLRTGQIMANCLPNEISRKAIEMGVDPFYDDGRIPKFLTWVKAQFDD